MTTTTTELTADGVEVREGDTVWGFLNHNYLEADEWTVTPITESFLGVGQEKKLRGFRNVWFSSGYLRSTLPLEEAYSTEAAALRARRNQLLQDIADLDSKIAVADEDLTRQPKSREPTLVEKGITFLSAIRRGEPYLPRWMTAVASELAKNTGRRIVGFCEPDPTVTTFEVDTPYSSTELSVLNRTLRRGNP